ncbi:hypothetical protein [Deinococcus arenicola]|uniref:Uncharacterized protein n=1 Tax=Deinococcus arenicola TaxID=2994950 RepID=A0ABU4DVB4_9DEIO|nr:hypothetical protein [Deinococcus sp. ZS9-10]MDV6376377.1 hypothetical protein [Deinococcus sp. ZS9-10]
MSIPNSRDGYKQSLLLDIYKLVQAIETDDSSNYPTSLAQSIHSDTREYFNAERWKPSPVYEGILTRIPTGEVVTLHIRMWQAETPEDEQRCQQWVTGKVVKIERLYRPDDGARFGLVPTGKRNPRSFQYRAVVSSSLKVWRGKLTPQQAQARKPFYHHETIPPVQYNQEASA